MTFVHVMGYLYQLIIILKGLFIFYANIVNLKNYTLHNAHFKIKNNLLKKSYILRR